MPNCEVIYARALTTNRKKEESYERMVFMIKESQDLRYTDQKIQLIKL